jgi:ATP-binding cassette subfamily F protein 3
MSAAEGELQEMQAMLSDGDLYSEARKGELADLLKREGELKTRAEQLEEAWFEQQHELEELGA